MNTSKKKNILLVEDEYFLAETLKARLEHFGYEVLSAEDGSQALALLVSHKVDMILMDAMLPIMDGFETTRQIKGNDKLKHIPILFLTARAREEDKQKALQCGADDYMTKPFESDELLDRIKKWTGA